MEPPAQGGSLPQAAPLSAFSVPSLVLGSPPLILWLLPALPTVPERVAIHMPWRCGSQPCPNCGRLAWAIQPLVRGKSGLEKIGAPGLFQMWCSEAGKSKNFKAKELFSKRQTILSGSICAPLPPLGWFFLGDGSHMPAQPWAWRTAGAGGMNTLMLSPWDSVGRIGLITLVWYEESMTEREVKIMPRATQSLH